MAKQTLSNITYIIWDLDGTLLDSFPIHVEVMGLVLKKHGLPVPPELEMAHHFHGSLEQSMRGLAGDVSEEKLAELLEDFLVIDNAYIVEVDSHLHPDAVDLAKRAHEAGIRQIIITNRAHGTDRGTGSPHNMVQNSVLSSYIDEILCGDEVEIRKPHPDVIKNLVQSINPAETLVIGDQYVDGELAYNLGAKALLVNRSTDPIAHRAKLTSEMHEQLTIVKSLSEVEFSN